MNKAEINDEIVALRQTVRLARTSFVLKTIREAKRLRNNHGNEKQMEKNKSKADKLLKEVYALKRIKDDDITKYGIACIEKLKEGMQNSSLDDATRAMIKVVRHKYLTTGILEIREKFPDYEEYVSMSKKRKNKKGVILEKPVKAIQKTPKVSSRQSPQTERNNLKDETLVGNLKPAGDVSLCTQRCSMKENEKETVKVEDAGLSSSIEGDGAPKRGEKEGRSSSDSSRARTFDGLTPPAEAPKVVSTEATVKRFTEILNDTSVKRATAPSSSGVETQQLKAPRIMDEFFLSEHRSSKSNDELSLLGFRNEGEQHRCVTETRGKKWTIWDNETSQRRGGGRGRGRGGGRGGDRGGSRGRARGQSESRSRNRSEYQNQNENKLNEITRGISLKCFKHEFGSERANGCANIESTKVETREQQSASLHPSWVARKKQQEIAKSGFQGKKIVFTDED